MKSFILTLRDLAVALVAIAGSIAAAFKLLLPAGSESDTEWRHVFVWEFILLELVVLACAAAIIVFFHRFPSIRKRMVSSEMRSLWPLNTLGVTERLYQKLPVCALLLGVMIALPWGYSYLRSSVGYFRHWRDESYNAYLRRNLSIAEHSFELRSARDLAQLLTKAELRDDYRLAAEAKVRAYDGLLQYLTRLTTRMEGPVKNDKDPRQYVFLCAHLIWLDPQNSHAPEAVRAVDNFVRTTEYRIDKLCGAIASRNTSEYRKIVTGSSRLVFDELLASQIAEQNGKTIQELMANLKVVDGKTLRLHLERVNGLPALIQIVADYSAISTLDPKEPKGRRILAEMQLMRGDIKSALKVEGKLFKTTNLPDLANFSTDSEDSDTGEGDWQYEFIQRQNILAVLCNYRSFIEHCHPADLLATGFLVDFIRSCKNDDSDEAVRSDESHIELEISEKICGMLAKYSRTDREKALVENLRVAMRGGIIVSRESTVPKPESEETDNTPLAMAIISALAYFDSKNDANPQDDWLAHVLARKNEYLPDKFSWKHYGNIVPLSTKIVDIEDTSEIEYLEDNQILALRNRLLEADKKTRFAVYSKSNYVTLFPFKTTMNNILLERIKGPAADDLRWFIFSNWLSEGWSGETSVLDSLPELKTYLEGISTPMNTDFLIYRRVLNLMTAHDQGILEENIRIHEENIQE